ncbi:MAG: N-acetylglucosamine-6-phosphate deacetylase [Clostridia bacterium]|nr:N-acetylglucosamine-6-phosphate deacetylase [Clostridia bacterium]
MKCFKNATVYVEGEGLKKTTVCFDEKIQKISRCADKRAEVIELPENAIVLPGFVDQHIHGAGGADAMDGTLQEISTIANTVVQEGTTTFLATTMTQSPENIKKALSSVKEYRENHPETGAYVAGVHLEGPFIAAAHKGAQPLEYVKNPDAKQFDEYYQASGNSIRIVTLAPETDGADELIAHLKALGVVASIGHTGAKFADIEKAVALGASNVTHTYNAQTGLHHREAGVVGAAMMLDELNCEMIADTIHVSVPAMRLLVKNKPADKLSLITDAMRAKGMTDGVYDLGGQMVHVKGDEARLADGTLAGSVLRMNRALQNTVEKVGVPFTQAVDYATINPARMLKLDEQIGSIKVGKSADFTVINENYDVLMTVRAGKVVYQA